MTSDLVEPRRVQVHISGSLHHRLIFPALYLRCRRRRRSTRLVMRPDRSSAGSAGGIASRPTTRRLRLPSAIVISAGTPRSAPCRRRSRRGMAPPPVDRSSLAPWRLRLYIGGPGGRGGDRDGPHVDSPACVPANTALLRWSPVLARLRLVGPAARRIGGERAGPGPSTWNGTPGRPRRRRRDA